MQTEIELAFQPLIGLPLSGTRRLAGSQGFYFGGSRTVKSRISRSNESTTDEVPEYALHVNCAWRIIRSGKMIVGSNDLNDPADDIDPNDFKLGVSGANRRDRLVSTLREEWKENPPIVSNCSADEIGGFSLTLSTGHIIDFFPDNSETDEYSEHWRLFQPYTDDPHIVVGNNGLEKIGPGEDDE